VVYCLFIYLGLEGFRFVDICEIIDRHCLFFFP
jgi:hypothetical protein